MAWKSIRVPSLSKITSLPDRSPLLRKAEIRRCAIEYKLPLVEFVPLVARFGLFCWHSAFFLSRVSPRELNLNPRQARGTQQQRQFPGVGQVVVEETPDRLQDR
jgi:hypothetical protein